MEEPRHWRHQLVGLQLRNEEAEPAQPTLPSHFQNPVC